MGVIDSDEEGTLERCGCREAAALGRRAMAVEGRPDLDHLE